MQEYRDVSYLMPRGGKPKAVSLHDPALKYMHTYTVKSQKGVCQNTDGGCLGRGFIDIFPFIFSVFCKFSALHTNFLYCF